MSLHRNSCAFPWQMRCVHAKTPLFKRSYCRTKRGIGALPILCLIWHRLYICHLQPSQVTIYSWCHAKIRIGANGGGPNPFGMMSMTKILKYTFFGTCLKCPFICMMQNRDVLDTTFFLFKKKICKKNWRIRVKLLHSGYYIITWWANFLSLF